MESRLIAAKLALIGWAAFMAVQEDLPLAPAVFLLLLYFIANIAMYIWNRKAFPAFFAACSIGIAGFGALYVNPLFVIFAPLSVLELAARWPVPRSIQALILLVPVFYLKALLKLVVDYLIYRNLCSIIRLSLLKLVMTMRATVILKAIQKLNPAEKHRLREYLIDALTASSSTGTVLQEISERKNKNGYRCPDCESEHIVRFGKYSTIVEGEEVKKQRYRCKACKKTFTDLTHTALYRTRRLNQWMKFIECMIEGYSLRKSAELIGNVTHVTLFYWRHKLLSSLKQLEISNFEGIVEMDETYFLYSEKGQRKIKDRKPRKRGGSAKKRGISNEQVCVLVARDRDKMTFSQVLGMGRLTKEQLDKAIGHKLSSENILCTDSWRAFKTYAAEKGMVIYQFKSDGKVRTKGLYHIQNVNN